jgi:hypothetical protein
VLSERLQRIVLTAPPEKLYTPTNLKVITAEARDQLLARAKQIARATSPSERTKTIHALDIEIANLTQAVAMGKAGGMGNATDVLLRRLEDAEARRKALQDSGQAAPARDDMQARLEKVLAQLPERVQAILEDLETVLASGHVSARQGHSRRPGD